MSNAPEAQQRIPSSSAPDWSAIRDAFPTTKRVTYLDIGRKALLPTRVEDAMREWMADIYDNAGADAFSMQRIEDTRDTVARVFGMPRDGVALIKNTSEGINIVAQGFPWRDGDNVVISELEHENNTFPWRHLARRGVEIRFATPDPEGRIGVDRYRELVDHRTRILGVAWVAYGNGYRANLAVLAGFCRERGIKLVVDGIQGVGVLATPIRELGADVLVAGGHKAQLGLAGAGFMYATPEMTDTLVPPYAAKFSFRSNDRFVAHPELARDCHRFEYGNPNFLGAWVQRRSAEFVEGIGLGHIEERVRALTTRLIEGAESLPVAVRTPASWNQRAGLVSLDLGYDASTAVERLRARDIVVSDKDGHLRAGVWCYNNEDDIDRLLAALKDI